MHHRSRSSGGVVEIRVQRLIIRLKAAFKPAIHGAKPRSEPPPQGLLPRSSAPRRTSLDDAAVAAAAAARALLSHLLVRDSSFEKLSSRSSAPAPPAPPRRRSPAILAIAHQTREAPFPLLRLGTPWQGNALRQAHAQPQSESGRSSESTHELLTVHSRRRCIENAHEGLPCAVAPVRCRLRGARGWADGRGFVEPGSIITIYGQYS